MRQLVSQAALLYRKKGLGELMKRSVPFACSKGNELVEAMNRTYNQTISSEKYNADGFCIFEEDWDNLIILDACRYDFFEKLNHFQGVLEPRTSRGSKTWEFMRGNFRDRNLLDTVYVTDNPWFGYLQDELKTELYYYHLGSKDAFGGAVTHP